MHKLTRFAVDLPLIQSSLPSDSEEEVDEIYQIAIPKYFDVIYENIAPNNNAYANSISIIGDTHAGKSTVINALLELFGNLENKVAKTAQSNDNYAPTTGDANLYISQLYNQNRIFFIDYEGFNGSELLPVDVEELETEEESKAAILRRNSAKEHFSRLALLSSDVVIIVSENDLANARTLESIEDQFLDAAMAGTENADKPFLVIISNKRTSSPKTIEVSTEKLKKSSPKRFKKLENHYCGVYAVELPHWNIVNGEQLFHSQMNALQSLLKSLLEKRQFTKRNCGTLISEKMWINMYTILVERCNERTPVNFTKILREILHVETSKVESQTAAFFELYSSAQHASYITLRHLVLHFTVSLLIQNYLKTVDNEEVLFLESNTSMLESEFKKVLYSVNNMLLREEPCKASKDGVVCKQVRCIHGKHHFAEAQTKSRFKSLTILKQKLKNLFGVSATHTWTGEFEPSVDENEEQFCQKGVELFRNALERARSMHMCMWEHFSTIILYDEFLNLDDLIIELVAENAQGKCIVCLQEKSTICQPCKHLFLCGKCKQGLYIADDYRVLRFRCLLPHDV